MLTLQTIEPRRDWITSRDTVTVGRISGLHGVKGWFKVYSHTEPPEQIIHYTTWLVTCGVNTRGIALEAGQRHGKGVIAKLRDVDDRDSASQLMGCEVAVAMHQLEPLPENEFYWAELIGLDVVNPAGDEFGVVESMLETGAHDVLVVKGDIERLLPYVHGDIVKTVDLQAGRITVDWELDY